MELRIQQIIELAEVLKGGKGSEKAYAILDKATCEDEIQVLDNLDSSYGFYFSEIKQGFKTRDILKNLDGFWDYVIITSSDILIISDSNIYTEQEYSKKVKENEKV